MPAHPRQALPLPPELAARYALPGPVVEEALVPIGGQDGIRFFRGRARAGDEVAEFTFLLPQTDRPVSFVLTLPILGGGDDLMWIVASQFAAQGHAVGWAQRPGRALAPGQRSDELERLFRRSVVQNRILLAWARQQPEIDPQISAAVGISTGGLLATVLTAVDPTLTVAALCLAGGDLPDLLLRSDERRVVEWRAGRLRDDGVGAAELAREIARELVSDPLRFGAYIEPERVLLVSAEFDTVVPPRNQDLLWESLGRPERMFVPLGHYSAALALPVIVSRIHGFLDQRAEQAGVRSRLARRGPPRFDPHPPPPRPEIPHALHPSAPVRPASAAAGAGAGGSTRAGGPSRAGRAGRPPADTGRTREAAAAAARQTEG